MNILIDTLESYGCHISEPAEGKLRIHSGTRLPPELLAIVREHKQELLEHLRAYAKEGERKITPQTPQDTENTVQNEYFLAGLLENNPANPPRNPANRPAQTPQEGSGAAGGIENPQPGICGSCTWWSPAAEWGTRMGTCGQPAHAFTDGRPLALHAAHRCIARSGEGWRGVQ